MGDGVFLVDSQFEKRKIEPAAHQTRPPNAPTKRAHQTRPPNAPTKRTNPKALRCIYYIVIELLVQDANICSVKNLRRNRPAIWNNLESFEHINGDFGLVQIALSRSADVCHLAPLIIGWPLSISGVASAGVGRFVQITGRFENSLKLIAKRVNSFD